MLKLDCLFNTVGALCFLIIALLAQINPPVDPQIDPPGNIIVNIAWPPGKTDVDLWVQQGGERAVGYAFKSGAVWSLVRDDLGTANDAVPINAENAFARATPDGEYAINVHCFGCTGRVPVDVAVDVLLADGTRIWKGTVTLVADKQERTAIRFRLSGGKLVPGSANQVFKQMRRA